MLKTIWRTKNKKREYAKIRYNNISEEEKQKIKERKKNHTCIMTQETSQQRLEQLIK